MKTTRTKPANASSAHTQPAAIVLEPNDPARIPAREECAHKQNQQQATKPKAQHWAQGTKQEQKQVHPAALLPLPVAQYHHHPTGLFVDLTSQNVSAEPGKKQEQALRPLQTGQLAADVHRLAKRRVAE